MSQQSPDKVSVDVVKRDEQFFADVGFNDAKHSLGPTKSRDEIYSLIFGFISDLRLITELERKRNKS
ncbi:hypothetical protein [Kaarinaea lacus]